MAHEPNEQVDAVTGVTTTGHSWDDIQELNNPLPRWWLWTFYVTIAWAIAYCVAYPAWPLVSSYTKGVLGWQSREAIVAGGSKLMICQRSTLPGLPSCARQKGGGSMSSIQRVTAARRCECDTVNGASATARLPMDEPWT